MSLEERGMWNKVVIVGAGGPVGLAVLDEILDRDLANQVVLTSRKGSLNSARKDPRIQVAKLDVVAADGATVLSEIAKDAEVIFCCVGLEQYLAKVWKRDWPKITNALIEAGNKTGAVIVFTDNLYAFGPEGMNRMPLKASDTTFTKDNSKGKPMARAQTDQTLLDAHAQGKCKAALVRGSDFFGPRTTNSALGIVLGDVVKNKTPFVLGDPKFLHAQTYVPDFAKALVAVAQTPTAWGRAWHVPNAPACSTVDLLKRIGEICGNEKMAAKPNYNRLDGFLLSTLAFFMSSVSGLKEMIFQWHGDYTVDHSDFTQAFPDVPVPTPWDVSLPATVEWFKANCAK